MKERPIIFSGAMVRALLAGTKTQTRRLAPVESLDITSHDDGMTTWAVSFAKAVKGVCGSYSGTRCTPAEAHRIIASQFCPYGRPGDRLWVRETFMRHPADYCWEASVSIPIRPAETVYMADHEGESVGAGWTPSIFMPRDLSRITLEITDVRVQRLQDISEDDARAEGCQPVTHDDGTVDCGTRKATFAALWESIHGAGSWDANPWVWALTFRRVRP